MALTAAAVSLVLDRMPLESVASALALQEVAENFLTRNRFESKLAAISEKGHQIYHLISITHDNHAF
jgi:hypothetical protein